MFRITWSEPLGTICKSEILIDPESTDAIASGLRTALADESLRRRLARWKEPWSVETIEQLPTPIQHSDVWPVELVGRASEEIRAQGADVG